MTKANHLGVLQCLYMLRMAEGASIRSHIVEFISLVTVLKNMDQTFLSEEQVMMLFYSLPPFYRHFRKTLIYSHESLKIDEIKFALLNRDKMEHDSGSRDDTTSDLVIKGRSNRVVVEASLDLSLDIVKADFDIIRRKGTRKQNVRSSKKKRRKIQVI